MQQVYMSYDDGKVNLMINMPSPNFNHRPDGTLVNSIIVRYTIMLFQLNVHGMQAFHNGVNYLISMIFRLELNWLIKAMNLDIMHFLMYKLMR